MAVATEPSPPLGPGNCGFAGLGAMGLGMATNLMKAGFAVSGFDVFPKALDAFASRRGRVSTSLSEASRGQSKFFVMVASPQQVDGLVPDLVVSLSKDAILCLFSTLPAAYILELKSRLELMGRDDIRLLDCPVSGGVVGANAGKLTIMTSGNIAALQEIQRELEAVAAPGRLFNAGPLGSASTIKMLNQHLAGSHVVAAAETLAFAKALGLPSREAHRLLMESQGASWIMGDRGISMLNADFSPKSAVTIFTKDMGIVNSAADNSSLPCPIASVAYQSFMERASRGHGKDDDSSVVCNYEDVVGLKVCEPLKPNKAFKANGVANRAHRSVVLVMRSGRLADRLEQVLAAGVAQGGRQSLRIIRCLEDNQPPTLSSVSSDEIVGLHLAEETSLQKLRLHWPEHTLFDFQIVHSSDYQTLQVLFSATDSHVGPTLEAHLSTEFSIIPVEGPIGSALSMYTVVQYASLIHLAAAAECYSLAKAQSVSVEVLYKLISGAAGSSAQFNQMFPKMIAQDFTCDPSDTSGSLRDALEELRVLQRAARNINFPGRMLNAAHQVFKKVSSRSEGLDRPQSALVLYWD